MARSSWMLLLLLLLRLMAAFWLLLGLAHTVAAVAAATKPTYTLGLLAPAAASEIPTSLVTEWFGSSLSISLLLRSLSLSFFCKLVRVHHFVLASSVSCSFCLRM